MVRIRVNFGRMVSYGLALQIHHPIITTLFGQRESDITKITPLGSGGVYATSASLYGCIRVIAAQCTLVLISRNKESTNAGE